MALSQLQHIEFSRHLMVPLPLWCWSLRRARPDG
jgi:hypothetical protein